MIAPISSGKTAKQSKDAGPDAAVLSDLLPGGVPSRDRPALYRDGNVISLAIPAHVIHDDPGLQAFISFVTDETVKTLLASASRKPEEVDTLVVSGRGALWPGLRERVERQFRPDVCRADFYRSPELMKEAVVRGALAWQKLARDRHVEIPRRDLPPLAVCLADGELYPLKPDAPPERIDLTASPSFTVLQCQVSGLDRRPPEGDPRRWFFVDVFNRDFLRAEHWEHPHEPHLFASVEKTGPHSIVVRLLNNDGYGHTLDSAATNATHVPGLPPWPIGSPILPPEGR